METWYKAEDRTITEVEVIVSTAKKLRLATKRTVNIDSIGVYYGKTREEAKSKMIVHYEWEHNLALKRLNLAKKYLDEALTA